MIAFSNRDSKEIDNNEKDYLRCRQRLWQQAFGLALTAMAKKTANLKPEQTA